MIPAPAIPSTARRETFSITLSNHVVARLRSVVGCYDTVVAPHEARTINVESSTTWRTTR
jgi:hypothetical protein